MVSLNQEFIPQFFRPQKSYPKHPISIWFKRVMLRILGRPNHILERWAKGKNPNSFWPQISDFISFEYSQKTNSLSWLRSKSHSVEYRAIKAVRFWVSVKIFGLCGNNQSAFFCDWRGVRGHIALVQGQKEASSLQWPVLTRLDNSSWCCLQWGYPNLWPCKWNCYYF